MRILGRLKTVHYILSRPKNLHSKTSGFTLIEVLIITPILMLTVVALLAYLFTLFGQFVQKNTEVDMRIEAQAAMFIMRDDMQIASAFSSQESSATKINDPHKSSPWVSNTTPFPTLIVVQPSYTGAIGDPSRKLIHVSPTGNSGCQKSQDIIDTYEVAYNNIIYFVENGTLYRRILTHYAQQLCGTPYLVQTCEAGVGGPTCPDDKILASNVTGFQISYIQPGNIVTQTPEQSELLIVTLTQQQTIAGDIVTSTSSTTLKRLGE